MSSALALVTIVLAAFRADGVAAQGAPNASEPLMNRLDRLEALVKRLHGFKSAVVKFDFDATVEGAPGRMQLLVVSCEPREAPGPGSLCAPEDPDALVIATDLLGEEDQGSGIVFDATSAPDYAAIVERLTNDEDDHFALWARYGGAFPASARSAPESSFFFRGFGFGSGPQDDFQQTSSGPGFLDLAGLEIDHITVSVDRLTLVYDEADNETDVRLEYRVFFGLPD
jgi:hypothetical protein